MRNFGLMLAVVILLQASQAYAAPTVTVTLKKVSAEGIGIKIGTLTLLDSPTGLQIVPKLTGLSPGAHGIHIHENPDCAPGKKDGVAVAAGAAGGHFDPAKAGKHAGPEGSGHKGDLPFLMVEADGTTKTAITAPHVTLADVIGRSIVIHGGGDNYSDSPAPLGGGGPRVACGLIEQ